MCWWPPSPMPTPTRPCPNFRRHRYLARCERLTRIHRPHPENRQHVPGLRRPDRALRQGGDLHCHGADQRCGWQPDDGQQHRQGVGIGSRATGQATSWTPAARCSPTPTRRPDQHGHGGFQSLSVGADAQGRDEVSLLANGVLWKYDQGTFTNTGGGGFTAMVAGTAKPSSCSAGSCCNHRRRRLHLPRWQRVLRHERRPGRSGPGRGVAAVQRHPVQVRPGHLDLPQRRRLHRGGRRAGRRDFRLFNGTLFIWNDVTTAGTYTPMAASPR